jgi:hypothetical protein
VNVKLKARLEEAEQKRDAFQANRRSGQRSLIRSPPACHASSYVGSIPSVECISPATGKLCLPDLTTQTSFFSLASRHRQSLPAWARGVTGDESDAARPCSEAGGEQGAAMPRTVLFGPLDGLSRLCHRRPGARGSMLSRWWCWRGRRRSGRRAGCACWCAAADAGTIGPGGGGRRPSVSRRLYVAAGH